MQPFEAVKPRLADASLFLGPTATLPSFIHVPGGNLVRANMHRPKRNRSAEELSRLRSECRVTVNQLSLSPCKGINHRGHHYGRTLRTE